jgi:hypothetical protein
MKTNFTDPSQSYMTPEIEVTEIIAEGVLCSSIAAPDWSYDEDIIY